MGRLVKLAGLTALALPILVLLGWVFYSRAAFGTWNPLAPPSRIEYCDRRYYPGSHFTRAHIDATGNGLGAFPFLQVGITAGGTPFFAKPLPDSVRHQDAHGPVLPCDMSVYLKVGPDDYIAYGISGGP
jgi:hypothetical protein